MGTTGTIMGTSTHPAIQIMGPASGSQIPVSVNGQKNILKSLMLQR
jgi:hypothetical protein